MVIELIEAMQLAGASDANLSIETPMEANISALRPILPNVLDLLDWIQVSINI